MIGHNAEVEEKLRAMDKHFQDLLEERNGKIAKLEAEKAALENQIAMELEKHRVGVEEVDKKLELVKKVQVLEREKEEIEVEFCKIKDDLLTQTLKNSDVNKHFQDLLEEMNGKIAKLVAEKAALENQMAMELEKHKEKKVELVKKAQVLEREKEEMEAECCKLKDDLLTQTLQNSNVNKALVSETKRLLDKVRKKENELLQRVRVLERAIKEEGNKMVLELYHKIVVLERELETKVCRAKGERSEEMKTILNEKKDLEMEKRELEVESRKKDERIKVLEQEIERLEDRGKETEMNWCVTKPHEDGESPQQVHAPTNAVILSTLSTDNPGPKSANTTLSAEPRKSSQGNVYLMLLGSDVGNQGGTKRDGLTEDRLVLKSSRDMIRHCTMSDESCIRSVCALYRKYKSLGDWKNCNKGFQPPYETRGMVLGELLTGGDPEGKLKKSLAELEEVDTQGLHDCRSIALGHHKEFEIYKSNLDPIFILENDN